MPNWQSQGILLESHDLATFKRDVLKPGAHLPDFFLLPSGEDFGLADIRQSPELALIPVLALPGVSRNQERGMGLSAWDGLMTGQAEDAVQIRQILACNEPFLPIEDWEAHLVRQHLFVRYLVSRGGADFDAMRLFGIEHRRQLISEWKEAGWLDVNEEWLCPSPDLGLIAARSRFQNAAPAPVTVPISYVPEAVPVTDSSAGERANKRRVIRVRRRKRLPVLAAGIALGLALGVMFPRWARGDFSFGWATQGAALSSVGIATASASVADFSPSSAHLLPSGIEFGGSVAPHAEIILSPWSASLKQAPLSPGALVSPGTVIAKLELPDERSRIEALELRIAEHLLLFESVQGEESARLFSEIDVCRADLKETHDTLVSKMRELEEADAAWKEGLGNTSPSVGNLYVADRNARELRELREEIRGFQDKEARLKTTLVHLTKLREACLSNGSRSWIDAETAMQLELSSLKAEMAKRVVRAKTRGRFAGYNIALGSDIQVGQALCAIEDPLSLEFDAVTASGEWHDAFESYEVTLRLSKDKASWPMSFVGYHETPDGTGRARFTFKNEPIGVESKTMGIVTLIRNPSQE